jgi:hypothetical protein
MSLRLIRAVQRAESSAAEKRKRRKGPVGICFSADFVGLDRSELAEGAVVVVDLRVVDGAGSLYLKVGCLERLSAGPNDRGTVYGADGVEVLGYVVGVDGAFVSVEWLDGGLVVPYRARVVGAAPAVRRVRRAP